MEEVNFSLKNLSSKYDSFHFPTTPSTFSQNTNSDFKNYPHSVDLCPECGNIVYKLYDSHRAELFCKECGIIDADLMPVLDIQEENIRVSDEDLAKTFNTFTRIKTGKGYERQAHKFRRIEWLKERYDRTTEGNKDLWRKQTVYINYIGIVNANFMMTKQQKKDAERLIHEIGNLKTLCQNCKYEQIVTAICVYVMRKDKRDIRVNKNKFCRDHDLSNNKYMIITERIAQFFEKKNNFPH